MTHEYAFTCPLHDGLHARPAGHFSGIAKRFASEVWLTNERTGAIANAKSILAIVGADVKLADPCRLRVEGPDQDHALAAIREFVEQVLPGCDEPLTVPAAAPGRVILPRVLRKADVRWLAGTPVSRGIGQGIVVIVGGLSLPVDLAREGRSSSEAERRRLDRALVAVREEMEQRVVSARREPRPPAPRPPAARPAGVESGIIQAHLAIATDVALHAKMLELIAAGSSAGQAIVAAGEFFMDQLRRSESALVRERAADLQDVCLQLLETIYGERFRAVGVALTQASVVVAENLTPRQLLSLDRRLLRGLILGCAGATSHTVILARSFSIPTLTGVRDVHVNFRPDQEVVVDANLGIAVTEVTPSVRRFYDREVRTIQARRERIAPSIGTAAATRDGRRIEIAANVSTAEELGPAFEQGAEGVGLFRTEMLFLDRESPPSEDEQFAVFVQAARAAGGRPVIIRTFDIGGDKPAPYLRLPLESNPFLGYRGVRIYREHEALFIEQVRAILRASAFGPLWLMAPMISTLDEVRWIKERIARVQSDLKSRGVAFDPHMRVGSMIEVPSVAFILDQLCGELDFFSIGTNDLAQYFLAVDRDNAKVAGLYSSRHPAFLRLLAMIVEGVHRGGRWVGLCGEMGRDAANLPLLVGLGLDEISVAAPDVLTLKANVARLSAAECRQVLHAAMCCASVAEVEAILRQLANRTLARPLLDRELVQLDSDSAGKEEVIREIADAFYVAGRTDDPQALEEALWAREDVYATGVGHGFAIPHCKTDAIVANSIGVARLRRPIDWGSEDGQAVQMVILLAIRASDQDGAHMRVLAQLARKLMHGDFRATLLAAPDRDAIVSYLSSELGIARETNT